MAVQGAGPLQVGAIVNRTNQTLIDVMDPPPYVIVFEMFEIFVNYRKMF